MKKFLLSAALIGACGVAVGKLAPPDEAAKAKAAETAARTAWQGKVDAFLLCKSQDKVAAHYRKTAPGAAAAAAAAPAAPAAKPVAAVAPGKPAAPAAVAGAAPASTCADPGVFAYTPPEQKPIEVSGAHSPAGTAASPPSTKTPAAALAPAKK